VFLLCLASASILVVVDVDAAVRKERVARISAHDDHVNAVAFADAGSQVLY